MKWFITVDYIDNGHSEGVCSRSVGDTDEVKHHPKATRFRLLDAEGEVLYMGLSVGKGWDPLTYFALEGCTSIEFWSVYDQAWQVL